MPIIFFVIVLGWLCGWTFLAVFIMSVGEVGPRAEPFQFATEVKWS